MKTVATVAKAFVYILAIAAILAIIATGNARNPIAQSIGLLGHAALSSSQKSRN